MNAISLFSGIGGLDLSAEAAGIEPVLFCEIEPYAVQILRKRWPHVPVLDDPEPWQGWPAGMGAEQFDYEPPRMCGRLWRKPNRAKRLKCLGNAVVPQQFAAFFEAIREMNT